jgi:hypothetical protein
VAVEIEFANVIIRKYALAAKYPGGPDAFAAADLPNYTEDAHLVRVGFMSTSGAIDLADDLAHHGLTFDDTTQSDIAIVQHDSCPDWLTTGPVSNTIGCWLADTDPGAIIKCKNGFLLRCPRNLFRQLESVAAISKITVTRSQPRQEDREDFIEVIHFSRDGAFIAANVVGDTTGKNPVGLWACRDFKRRQQCAADIKFAEEIESLLLENGAMCHAHPATRYGHGTQQWHPAVLRGQ